MYATTGPREPARGTAVGLVILPVGPPLRGRLPAMVDWDALVRAASEAREHAYAPYSEFAVGAAVLFEDGSVVPGCNVENRTFGLTVCAERNAVTTGVAAGRRIPQAVAIVTANSPPSPPCGMCLETLRELTDDLPILLANPAGERREHRLRDLLPFPFEMPARA
jgi:cytidine deaminase